MGQLDGVFLYDLDDLKSVAEANLRAAPAGGGRGRGAGGARRSASSWSGRSRSTWCRCSWSCAGAAEEIRRAEIEKARARLGPLTPEQEQALEAATAAIVNKMLHGPTVQLKELATRRPSAGADRPDPQAARAVTADPDRLARQRARALAGRARAGAARPLGHECRIQIITTTGDRVQDRRLESVGGKGAFLKEIEEAMLAGEVDLAVHSLKDVPTALPDGLRLCAVLERADPRDALAVGRRRPPAPACPPASRIGTSSLRRQCQLRALRPDLEVVDLRGNVDTRLARLRDGRCDAIVLAMAGLARLGRADEVTEALDPGTFVPAPGQGAIALECRVGRRRGRGGGRAPAPRAPPRARSRPSAPCSRRWAEAATSRSAPTPPRRGRSCGWSPSLAAPTARRWCAGERRGADPGALGRGLAEDLLARGAAALLAP